MNYNIAQVNIARMLAPIDSPVMAGFVNNLDRINAVAEQSDGFIWRLKDEDNNATSLKIFEDDYLIVNMSVWASLEALFQFTYKSTHTEVFKRKKEWFSKMEDMHMACWYVEETKVPTTEEAKERLAYLNKYGETPYAFTFRSKFSAVEAAKFVSDQN